MNLSILRPFECGFNNLYSIPAYILNSEVSFVKLNSQKWTHWVSFISLSFFPQFTTDWNFWNLSGWTPIVLTFSFFAVLYIISLIVWVDTGNTYSNSLSSVVVGALITILNFHSKTPFRFFCINFLNGHSVKGWGFYRTSPDSNMGPKNIKSQPSLRGRGVSDTDIQTQHRYWVGLLSDVVFVVRIFGTISYLNAASI